MRYIKIFISGFLQIFFVPINTYFIIKNNYLGVGICAFIMCLIWIFNVKNAVLGNKLDKFIYCIGASTGACIGLLLYNKIL